MNLFSTVRRSSFFNRPISSSEQSWLVMSRTQLGRVGTGRASKKAWTSSNAFSFARLVFRLGGVLSGRVWAHFSMPVSNETKPLASRSEEHTSELQSLMRISYAVFCLKKKTKNH